jgi:hypothetical protein
MFPPYLARTRCAVVLAAVTFLALCAGGCVSALFTPLYMLNGNNIEAEFKGLKGKRVAVVCRPLVLMKYRNANVAKDLAREVTLLLKKNVPKIQVVEHGKVAEWMDENTWEEYVEVGKAVGAEVVVGIDLERFDLLAGQTVYQGRANVTLKVYDCKSKSELFSKSPPQIAYPANHVVSSLNKQEVDFRREFVSILADQIARHFYAHDPHADVAMDSRAMD